MSIVQFLLANIGSIFEAVVKIQAAAKGVPGETKKQIILNVVDAAALAGEQVPEGHTQAISGLVDQTVQTLKATNMLGFGSSATPAPSKPAIQAVPAALPE